MVLRFLRDVVYLISLWAMEAERVGFSEVGYRWRQDSSRHLVVERLLVERR